MEEKKEHPNSIRAILANPNYTPNEKRFFLMCAALYLLGPTRYAELVRKNGGEQLPPAPEEV